MINELENIIDRIRDVQGSIGIFDDVNDSPRDFKIGTNYGFATSIEIVKKFLYDAKVKASDSHDISLIWAMGECGEIGIKNDLPWDRLEGDLLRFKTITTGHPIIMGRKTYESIGKPLPYRENIVLTRDRNFKADGVTVFHDIGSVLDYIGDRQSFVIGGAKIYEMFMPLANRVYVTEVETTFPDADVIFRQDSLNHYSNWNCTDIEYHGDHDPPFTHKILEKPSK